MPFGKKSDKPVAWDAFLAARMVMWTKMAGMDKNWERLYKIVEPLLKKEIAQAAKK